jgi:hypothetical protein
MVLQGAGTLMQRLVASTGLEQANAATIAPCRTLSEASSFGPIYWCCCSELELGNGEIRAAGVGAEGASSSSRWKQICRWPPLAGAVLVRGDIGDGTIEEEERSSGK